jgi:ketosteroid isomerase-like protein
VEERRDAGVTSGLDLIREFNDAVERQDLEAISKRLRPDAVWRHNIGVGTVEEGVYEGRDSVVALFKRILEPWEYIRATPSEVRDVGDGVFVIEGELQAKHRAATTEIVTPYVQRLELKDGLLARGEMVAGFGARLQ